VLTTTITTTSDVVNTPATSTMRVGDDVKLGDFESDPIDHAVGSIVLPSGTKYVIFIHIQIASETSNSHNRQID
jgi:hydrogenase maturation factor HypE